MSSICSLAPVVDESHSDLLTPTHPLSEPVGTIYCSCLSEYCDCDSTLRVTQAAARNIYQHLGFTKGHEMIHAGGYRENTIHLWGTHNLSTKKILTWLEEYEPSKIEWINDASCNVVFPSANHVLRVIVDFTEPFDRHVALTAAATLLRALEKQDKSLSTGRQATDISESCDENSSRLANESKDSIEQFSQYLPPSGRWYKALSVPDGAISLFLRLAHQSDVKLPGAERRSLYYRRYGNPNYGGLTGILSRSNRRKLRLAEFQPESQMDTRNILLSTDSDTSVNFEEAIARIYVDPDAITTPNKAKRLRARLGISASANEKPRRQLIVYDNLNEVTGDVYKDGMVRRRLNGSTRTVTGSRREAIGFGIPSSTSQPRKWPRKEYNSFPSRRLLANEPDGQSTELEGEEEDYLEDEDPPSPSDKINVVDLRQLLVSRSSAPQNAVKNRYPNRHDAQSMHDLDLYTTTITLMPETLSPVRLMTQDDDTDRTHRLLASLTMVADREEVKTKRSLVKRIGSLTHRQHLTTSSRRVGNVWDRLG